MAFKWMQNNSSVTVTFAGPSSKKKEDVDVIITATNFKAGLRGAPPVCEGTLFAPVKPAQSKWVIKSGTTVTVTVTLEKQTSGKWPSIFSATTPGSSQPPPPTVVMYKMKVTFEYEAQDPFELTIKDGDIINVISEDPSGWFKGELNGVIGTFPSNFAEQVKEEEEEAPPPVEEEKKVSAKPRCRGTFPYEAQADGELGFREGDVISVLLQDPSGWWQGELNGQVGWFPSNFVELIPERSESADNAIQPEVANKLDEVTANTQRLTHTMRASGAKRRPPTKGRTRLGSTVKCWSETEERTPVNHTGGSSGAPASADEPTTTEPQPAAPARAIGNQSRASMMVNAQLAEKLRGRGDPSNNTTKVSAPLLRKTAPTSTPGPKPAVASAPNPSPTRPLLRPAGSSQQGTKQATPARQATQSADNSGGAPVVRPKPVIPNRTGTTPARPVPAPTKTDATTAKPEPAKTEPATKPEAPTKTDTPTPAPEHAPTAKPIRPVVKAPQKTESPTPAHQRVAKEPHKPESHTPKEWPSHLPPFAKFCEDLVTIFQGIAPTGTANKAIPYLARVQIDQCGFAICTVTGQLFSHGSGSTKLATLQGCCRPILYAVCNEVLGTSVASGFEKAAEEADTTFGAKPANPFTTSGVMYMAGLLLQSMAPSEVIEAVSNKATLMAGSDVSFNMGAYISSIDNSNGECARAYTMRHRGNLPGPVDVEPIIDAVLQANSIQMNCSQAATYAASLANNFHCPTTKQYAGPCGNSMTSFMSISGGISQPSVNGSSGVSIVAIPGVCGIAVLSPALSADGSSYQGVEFLKQVLSKFKFQFSQRTDTIDLQQWEVSPRITIPLCNGQ